jgi:[acyl-carrier-protein] S-malonyltransferase
LVDTAAIELQRRMPRTALAFRGYNITNLGRTAEFLAHPAYGPVFRACLGRAARLCSEIIGRIVAIEPRVIKGLEGELENYAEDVALILAVEQAQLACLEQFFAVHYRDARMAFGYSLGEIAAVAASGVIEWEDAMRIPLSLANDCADLAHGVTLAVLFSRARMIPVNAVKLLCLEINQEGDGVMGMSAKLAPNSLLLMGQGTTLDRFKDRMSESLPEQTHLRKNSNVFPPMHTPIVWERSIPNRAGVLLHSLRGPFAPPDPPVFSLVTSRMDYNALTARDILQRWTDHPQMLWDAVQETFSNGTEVVLHIGPDPNLIPATYKRVSDNVQLAAKQRFGWRAVQVVARQSWLSALLPEGAALLRAPLIEHVILEDWLLSHSPS